MACSIYRTGTKLEDEIDAQTRTLVNNREESETYNTVWQRSRRRRSFEHAATLLYCEALHVFIRIILKPIGSW